MIKGGRVILSLLTFNVRLSYLISKKLTPDSIKKIKNRLACSYSLSGFLHSPDLLTVLDEAVTGYRHSVENTFNLVFGKTLFCM